MTNLFRNSSPGALTLRQSVEQAKKRLVERGLQMRKARELAAQGRGGDTEIAHVTPGEIVLPDALQTPAVLDAIRQAAMDANISLDRVRVGSPLNSINPRTGQPEFFEFSDLMPWGKGRSYDPCSLGMQTEGCEGWVPGFLKDKPSNYMPTQEDLDRLPDAQKEQYARLYEGSGAAEDVLGTGLSGVGRLFGGAGRWALRQVGKAADDDAATRAEIARAYRGAIRNPKPGP